MSEKNNFEIIKTVGFAVIEASHRRFEFEGVDNEEHIPALKSSIEAIVNSAGTFVSPAVKNEIAAVLRNYALELFVDLCLRLGSEDDDDQGLVVEKKRAINLFNKIYENTL